jgi:serine protease Do
MVRHSQSTRWISMPALLVAAGQAFSGLPTPVWAAAGLAEAAIAPAPPADAPPASSEVDDAFRRELRRTIGIARDRVFPALVSIDVVTVAFHGGKEIKGQSTGSGTVFTAEGHVLTNAHVTIGGRKFTCTLSDQRKVSARLIGEDPLTDLAVLQLDLAALGAGGRRLPFAAFGDSDSLEIGDYVMAMGSPFSLSRSVSLGIVSNTERVFPGGFGSDDDDLELEQGQRTGLFTRWIQHDALISPGNSGGPLVNLEGQVVGVNELGGGNLSFAIPSNLAARIGRELIARGGIERGWLGLGFVPLDAEVASSEAGAAEAGLDGARIAAVEVDSPASRAGVLPGDVLAAVDGEKVVGRVPEDMPSLLDLLASRPVGSELEMTLRRGASTLRLKVQSVPMDKDVGEQTSFHAWGLTAQEITPKMARDLRLADTSGVLVTGVRRGGPAQLAEPPLEEGDVLREVGRQPVGGLGDLVRRYGESTTPERETASLLFAYERRGAHQLTLIQPRVDSEEEPPRELPKAWIGVASQPILPQLAEELGLGAERGFRLTRVYPGSEAEKAGLRVGDVILRLDGEALEPDALEDGALLARRVRTRSIGDQVTLTLRRGAETLELPLALERTRLTKDEARRLTDHDFELSVRELTFFDRDENRWPEEARGVMIENVDGAGWAGLGGLRPNDLLLSIDGVEVPSLSAFRKAMRELERRRPEKVPVLIRRGSRHHALELAPDWTPDAARRTGAVLQAAPAAGAKP